MSALPRARSRASLNLIHFVIYLDFGQKQQLQECAPPPGMNVLRLAAFNIQIFGKTKFKKSEVVTILSRVIWWRCSWVSFARISLFSCSSGQEETALLC